MNDHLDTSGLLEETGEVVALQGDYAVIETRQRSACGQCSAGKSCGTSVLASLFGQRRSRVRLYNHLGVSIGDCVIVGIEESVLITTAILAYMLPLLVMIGFSIGTYTLLDTSDDLTFVAGVLGLFIGMTISNRIMGDKDFQAREIILLRLAKEPAIGMVKEKII